MKTISLVTACVTLLAASVQAQLFNFSTFAGPVPFNNPVGAATDSSGDIFVADADNNTIRNIMPDGTVITFAGSPGISGSADGNGTNALFNAPQGVAVDQFGNVFVSDTGNDTIRKITPDGTVSTLAGLPGIPGAADGTGTNAQFFSPQGIAVDASDDIFVADTFNHAIREITSAGVVTTLAGAPGFSGSADGLGSAARFNHPTDIAIDENGNLFVSDLFNHAIREIAPNGMVSTIAGLAGVFGSANGTNSNARFFEPEGIAFDGANLFVADAGNHSIRELLPAGTNWAVSTIAGWPGNSGDADGSGIAARFFYPGGLAMGTNGNLVVADSGNNTIRSGTMITNDPPTILTQPQNQDVNAGNAVTFSVSANGSATLYYQWQFDGGDIPGATGTNYTLAGAQSDDAGNYSVIVTSPTGSILSSNAVLTVYAPPVITNQPVSQAVLQGATVSFSVAAGPLPLTYQWRKNDAPLTDSANVSGVTTSTLTISNVTSADEAGYSVLIGNGHGDFSSSEATLTVFAIPPPDSIQPVAWWQLNEGTGTTAYDYSGSGHDGTLDSGAIWTNNGHAGNGVYFDASSTADITINNPFILSNDWTATMWVNRWESKDSSVLIGGSHDALKLEQHSHTNHVGYTYYSHTDYPLDYVTPLNTWTHLTFVKNSNNISLYVNGVFVTSSNATVSLDATTLGFGLPAAMSDHLDATLDDVRIYTNALTAQQITNIFVYGRITPIPAITLTTPTNGQSFVVATNIALAADVVSNDQNLVRVEFYSGTNLLGQSTAVPYTWTWTNVFTGNYSLTARAVFNGTNTVDSAPVDIGVAPATTPPSLTTVQTNGTLQLSWPLDHTGWRLQTQTNAPGIGLSTNWLDVSGSTATNLMMIPIAPTNGSVFYRMIYP
jgi:Concanavalin A-like lectin/glucanases superfamily/Bacterial Ig domain/Immunoglobulin domain/NHL repeat